ncbi:MAG: hypothetical protein IT431_17180 [Phycisphaerales bacterium]|nr:hypothetical protein [Phycisphaerales bacterium]
MRTGDGVLNGVVPMFLDPETSWSAPPAGPVDVILYADGRPVAGAHHALAITPLEEAPGSAESAVASLSQIATSLDLLAQRLAGEPGVDQQWLTSVAGALDELINGDNPNSFAGALAAADPQARPLLDAWFASSGMLAALEQYEQQLTALADGLPAGPASRTKARLRALQSAVIPISDAALAHKMQVYEQVKLFGEQVIAATSSTWSTYLGTAAGALNLVFNIPAARVPAAIIGVVLGLTDFTLNKIVLGLMPARISSLDLAVANPTPKPGEATNATLDLEVVNDPPQIGIQDVTSALLAAGGLGDLGSWGPKLSDVVSFFLNAMQAQVAGYAAQHPELNLDINISPMPDKTWRAPITNRNFVTLMSGNTNVLAPLAYNVDWQASTPSQNCGDDIDIWAFTAANTFGTQAAQSNHLSVHVDPTNPQVRVSPGFVDLLPGASKQFTVTGATSIQWTATAGTIDQNGNYTAPATKGTYTVTATDTNNPSCKGTATVNVRPKVVVTPAAVSLSPGDTTAFTATVTGATDTAVTWSTSGGTIDQQGNYTAPQSSGTYTITATSNEDPTSLDTVTATVFQGGANIEIETSLPDDTNQPTIYGPWQNATNLTQVYDYGSGDVLLWIAVTVPGATPSDPPQPAPAGIVVEVEIVRGGGYLWGCNYSVEPWDCTPEGATRILIPTDADGKVPAAWLPSNVEVDTTIRVSLASGASATVTFDVVLPPPTPCSPPLCGVF